MQNRNSSNGSTEHKAKHSNRLRLHSAASLAIMTLGTMSGLASGLMTQSPNFTTAHADTRGEGIGVTKFETSIDIKKAKANGGWKVWNGSKGLGEGTFPDYAKYGGTPLWHSVFTKNGYMAYCLQRMSYTPNNSSPVGSVSSPKILAMRVALNGYPMKSASDLGLNSSSEAIAATQYAVWAAVGGGSNGVSLSALHSNDGAAGSRVIAASKRIFAAAKKDKRGPSKPKFTLKQISKKTVGNNKVAKYKPSLSNDYKMKKATITKMEASSGVKIEQNGKTLKQGSSVSDGDTITVTYPKKQSKWKFEVGTHSDGYAQFKKLTVGGGRQDVQIQSTGSVNTLYLKKSVAGQAEKPDTPPDKPVKHKLTVHKFGEEDDPLKSVSFDLIDANTQKVIQNAVTNDDGIAEFKDLDDGDYIVREVHSDKEHETLLSDNDVTIDGDDEDISVYNTEIKDKPLIRSFATEKDSDSSKYNRTVDAKTTDVQDELLLDNLDAGHSYRVEDTAYIVDADTSQKDYSKEMEEAHTKDGKPATAETTFTADSVDESNGHDRGAQKLTLDHDNIDLTHMQGKRLVFQATIYRGDDAKTHAGDELAKEDTFHDANQTLKVASPKITTVATANGDSDSVAARDDNGNKVTNPYSKTHISDYAHLTGLVVGHKYSVHLAEMVKNKKTDKVEEYKDPSSGKSITADQTFTATDTEMDIKTNMPEFSTVGQNDKELTIYYNLTPEDESSNKLGAAENIDDKDETIRVTNPQLQTKALIDNDSITNPNSKASLEDYVTYKDVAPNQPLELGAIASDDHERAIVDKIANKFYYLMGKISFSPEETDGGAYVPLQLVDAKGPNTDANGNYSESDLETANLDSQSIKDASVRQEFNKLIPVDPADVAGDPVETARNSKGTSDVANPYQIDTHFLAGRSMTLFEDLSEKPDKPMASHADVNDKGQTVSVTNPVIHTEALLNDHHTSNPNRLSYLADKVSYEGVAPGHAFDMSALAVNPANGHNIVVREGKNNNDYYNLMGRVTTMPTTPKGEVNVPLQKVTATDESVLQAQNAANGDDTKQTSNTVAGSTGNKSTDSTTIHGAGDLIDGTHTAATSVTVTSKDTDEDIARAVTAIDGIADKYAVNHEALDQEFAKQTETTSSMTESQKVYVINEFNKVANDIKAAQERGKKVEVVKPAAAQLTNTKMFTVLAAAVPTATNDTPAVSASISTNDSDTAVKSAVATLKTIADRYSIDTTAVQKAVDDAKDPMTQADKMKIVGEFNAVSASIKQAQQITDHNAADKLPALPAMITVDSLDKDIKSSADDLATIATAYNLDTTSLNDALNGATDPMTPENKEAIVSAFTALMDKVQVSSNDHPDLSHDVDYDPQNDVDDTPAPTLKVSISTTDTDAQIKEAVAQAKQVATYYAVDTDVLDNALSSANDPMTDSDKTAIVNAFNVVAKGINSEIAGYNDQPQVGPGTEIDTGKDHNDGSDTNHHSTTPTTGSHNDGTSSTISVAISTGNSDAEIKQAVDSLEKIAARYDISTTALDNMLNKAGNPMSVNDKAAIVAAFSNVVAKIKAIQTADDDLVHHNDGENATNPNHANLGYETNLSGTAAAKQRLADNHLVPNKPDYDSTPINPHDKQYLIDTTALRGQKMVMTEDMSTSQGEFEDPITSEVDVNNHQQMVRVTNPAIHTMQTVNNRKNFVLKGDGENVSEPIADKVSFTDFAPGEKMTFTAVEMESGTQQPVIIDNQYMVGRKTIKPSTSDGVATVQFNEMTSVPNARYMTSVLDDSGLVRNNAVSSDISSTQDDDTNRDALDHDETNDAQANGSVNDAYQGIAGMGLGTDDTDAETDTTAYPINLQSLNSLSSLADGDEAKWVAYETVQSADGNIVAEHKNAADTGQTVEITHRIPTTPSSQGGLLIDNHSGQHQGEDGHVDSHNGENPYTPTTVSQVPSQAPYQIPSQLPSQARSVFASGQPLQTPVYAHPGVTRPVFGRTGGTDKLSNNWFYNLIYGSTK